MTMPVWEGEEVTTLRWIPVDKRMPAPQQKVMVWTGKAMWTDQLTSLNNWSFTSQMHNIKVTHWMPLPEPPEDES